MREAAVGFCGGKTVAVFSFGDERVFGDVLDDCGCWRMAAGMPGAWADFPVDSPEMWVIAFRIDVELVICQARDGPAGTAA